jgi:hypothetical protein
MWRGTLNLCPLAVSFDSWIFPKTPDTLQIIKIIGTTQSFLPAIIFLCHDTRLPTLENPATPPRSGLNWLYSLQPTDLMQVNNNITKYL